MAVILITVLPMPGAMAGTLAVATKLAARGHRVVFIGIADCAAHVEPRGFELVPVLAAEFPKGFVEQSRRQTWSWRTIKAATRRLRDLLERLADGRLTEVHDAIRAIAPDLFVIQTSSGDSALWGLIAHELGVRSVYLSTMFTPRADSWLPVLPPYTRFIVPGTALARCRSVAAWYWIYALDLLKRKAATALGVGLDPLPYLEALARKAGYRKKIDTRTLSVCNLDIPELILFPQALDFPRPERLDRRYAEAAIDLERLGEAFDWRAIDPRKPLLYCALGTLGYLRRPQLQRFFATVLAVMARRPDWQMVLATGGEPVDAAPPNVVCVPRAPQLEILQRAAAMITHGGANSIKECIYFGVPMVAFPLGLDHPGNAARIVYHRLGLAGDARRVSARRLEAMIAAVLGDPGWRLRCARMGALFRELEAAAGSVTILEGLLAEPARAA
jgi:zeaxanthin glucosyltransferase